MPRRDSKAGKKMIAKSGAVGGPGTAKGLNYQYDYAVGQALELMEEVLAAPHHDFEIQMEPRIGNAGDVTRWDFSIHEHGQVTELKFDPTKGDIVETITRAKSADNYRVRLVYSTGSGPTLVALDRLVRLATEASGNGVRFEELVAIESVKNADSILSILGSDAARVLSQFDLVPLPAYALERQIDFLSRRLGGDEKRAFLRDHLFHRFAKAAPQRQTISISKLIEELRGGGIELRAPVEIRPDDLSAAAVATVGILQECVTSLPIEVLSEAIPYERPVRDDLKALVDGGILNISNEIGLIKSLPSHFRTADHPNAVTSVLKALLAFISRHSAQKSIRRQVHNAVQLAKIVLPTDPRTAAGVFPVVEKILKRAGNKHLVLDVATLALAAVKRCPPSRGVTEMKAVALICGVSWAYQRLGCLREARLAGEKSLEIGESIGWPRNTAFCQKCLGRLCRLEAEQSKDPVERRELFAKSEEFLRNAIDQFGAMRDFGPEHPQVGDCNALLARTYLVQDKLAEAETAVSIADSLITDIGGKEHLDVVILRGDLAMVSGKLKAAEAIYTEALEIAGDDDDERTEMCARAHLQRGRARKRLGDADGAHRDYTVAAAIWTDLKEPKFAAEAELEKIPLKDSLGSDSRAILLSQPPIIALTAFKLHVENTERLPAAVAHRAKDPGAKYWKQMVKEAAAKVAIECPEP